MLLKGVISSNKGKHFWALMSRSRRYSKLKLKTLELRTSRVNINITARIRLLTVNQN